MSVVGFLFLLLWFRFSFWLVLRLHLVESILVYYNIFLVRCLVGVGFFFTFEVFFVEFCRFFAFDPFCLCSPLGHWSVRHFGFLSPVATFSFHNVVEPVLLWCLLIFFSLILFSSVSVRPVRLRCVFVFTFFCALHRASTWSAEKKENQKKNKRKKKQMNINEAAFSAVPVYLPLEGCFFCSKFIFYFWLLRCVRHFVSAEPLHFFF